MQEMKEKKGFPPGASWITVVALAIVVLGASLLSVYPHFGPPVAATGAGGSAAASQDQSGTDTTGTDTTGPGGAAVPGASGGPSTGQQAGGAASSGTVKQGATAGCNATNNGGNTDVGVTSNKITLASTIVNSGVGQSFLGPVQYGMQAVVAGVNRHGGICGRRLDLTLVDDGWNAETGCQDIQNFIHDTQAFALPVVPSSEGLTTCIQNGTIHNAKIPVIGTDGMLEQQYDAGGLADWVWPIATSTISTMHIMAIDAYKNHGARTFCLAYDNHYKFGQEGQKAFDSEVKRLGGTEVYDQGLDPNQSDYSAFIKTFNDNCSGRADFVGLLLTPTAAATWLKGGAYTAKDRDGAAGAQPMFTTDLGNNCGDFCDGIKVYTGFRPPLTPYSSMASVQQYINSVRAQSSSADLNNQFLEGGYDGMLLAVAALTAASPHLTRAAVRAYLDSAAFDGDGNGLTPPLHWKAGNHFANTSMLAYSFVSNSGSFQGFRADPTGFIVDPNPNLDT